jgi:glutathione S-transferase
MILIGQYDSPFVRRVGIALTWYGLDFEHRPWSTFGDAEAIAALNPLRRVPTLVLDDGMVLTDSLTILEVIDELIGPERAVLARHGAERRDMLRLAAFAAGAADKGVSLVYERAFREGLPMWVERCRSQVSDTLDLLDRERTGRGAWLFGDRPSHADVILATMFRFLSEALDGSFDMARWPALQRHSTVCEALPQFAAIQQPYVLAMAE